MTEDFLDKLIELIDTVAEEKARYYSQRDAGYSDIDHSWTLKSQLKEMLKQETKKKKGGKDAS